MPAADSEKMVPDRVIDLYCRSHSKDTVLRIIKRSCMEPSSSITIVDFETARFASVSKKRALKIMAKYVEENQ